MAIPDWWNDWTAGTYHSVLAPLEILNALIPYMQGAEQQQAARYLYGQRAADDVLSQWLGGYNVASPGRPTGQTDYLRNISRASTATMPSYLDSSSPEKNWLDNVLGLGRSLHPSMSRQQQRDWRSAYDTLLAEAPSDTMRSIASYLYNPSLTRPTYGSATKMGQYSDYYRTKGGLVANPYYAT